MEKNKEVEKGQEMHAHKTKQNSASKRKEQLRVTTNTAQWLKPWALEPESQIFHFLIGQMELQMDTTTWG